MSCIAETLAQSNAATGAAAAGVATTFTIGFLIIWGLIMILSIFLFIFWIMMIIDVAKRENWKDDSEKTLWLLIVILVGYLGAIIYYFALKRDRDKKK
ncbi:PLDc N-terminal domain-containing protein [Patescibacteria group bacterium]